MRTTLSVTAIIVAAGLASSAHAQCTAAWDRTIGNPGIGVSNGYVGAIHAYNDGTGESLYLGGSAPNLGGNYIARWNQSTNAFLPVGGPLNAGVTNAFITSMTTFDPGTGPELIVGGFYVTVAGVPGTRSLARWNGTRWAGLGQDFDPTQATAPSVWALAAGNIGQGNRLYIGGTFPSAGPVVSPGIAAWDGTNWSGLGSTGPTGPFNPNVFSLHIHNDGSGPALFAGGRFDAMNSTPGTALIAKWNGTSWSALGTGLVGSSITSAQINTMVTYNDGSGPALFVGGGRFRPVGTGADISVAKWNGSTWTPVGQNLGGQVWGLRVWDDGSGPALYLHGSAMPGIAYVAKLVGNTWVTYDGGTDNSVFSSTVWQNRLYLGGSFTAVGGQPAFGVVAHTSCAVACYPNCDGSTTAPILNAVDLGCFLQRYAAGDPYANCDASTTPPILNALDFGCFLQRYVAGCN